MSILNNSLLLGAPAAAGGYTISRSLRFNSSDSAYLSRTPASAGNRTTFTWAGWIKRCKLGSRQSIFSAGTGNGSGQPGGGFYFDSSTDTLSVLHGGGTTANLTTAQVFRDVSAWFHLVVAYDTTQGTSSNRVKIYVNGSQITLSGTYPSSSFQTDVNNTVIHAIGSRTDDGPLPSSTADFYLADVFLIDGQQLTPSSFGEFDSNNIWQPKAFAGSYGTNGFHLPLSDNSNNTASTLGKDTSGNSNNWTPNNLSVTAGAGNDSLVDSPSSPAGQTDSGAGGTVVGNYATLNPLVNISGHTFRNGNLEAVTSSSNYGTFVSTVAMPPSGKWYAESYISATSGYPLVGIAGTGCTFGTTSYLGGQATMYAYYGVNGNKYNNGTSTSYGATYTTGDTIGIAYDADAGTITFYKNGVSQGQAYSGITSGSYYFAGNEFNSASGTQIWNFGQRQWAYAAPANFKALCTANLPTPTIANPSSYFNAITYIGSSTPQTISGLNFTSDLIWIKSRSHNAWNILQDSIRGFGKTLFSNDTSQEIGNTNDLISSVSSTGFSVNTSYNGGTDTATTTNGGSYSYAAWCWDAGSSTVTNTAGSITSQVRANASAGFSVVTWTYGNAPTVGHGLGVAPSLIIAKSRTVGTDWVVYHRSLGKDKLLVLNGTDAAISSANYWGSSEPSSTVFGTVGNNTNSNNRGDMVAYVFSPVSGYSSAFSWTGNGSNDGPFIYCGFRPKLILWHGGDYATHWNMYDSVRDTYNVSNKFLGANLSIAEDTSVSAIDILSNGFKIRSSAAQGNQSGQTYIGYAWAESPFAYARAR